MNTKYALKPGCYRGYTAKNSKELYWSVGNFIELYGHAPKVILTRRPAEFEAQDLPIMFSRHPGVGTVWLGDAIPIDMPSDIEFLPEALKGIQLFEVSEEHKAQAQAENFPLPIILKPERGRPQRRMTCPFCKSLASPENLGHWAGWMEGKEPGYWAQLRMYVFLRDDFRCHKCHEKFPPEQLVAHHIAPKEQGGEDSSRNLDTYCLNHHPE